MNQIAQLIEAVMAKKPKRILLQVPEGLKTKTTAIAEAMEKTGISVFISADTCHGACDLPLSKAEMLGCDLIVHLGHSKFYRPIDIKIDVLYFPWKAELKIEKNKIKPELAKINEKKIGIVTTIQHMDSMGDISGILKSLGKQPVEIGQILGCWSDASENVDAFLFFGSGEFHPTGLFRLKKRIYFFDIEKNLLRDMDKEALLHEKRMAARVSHANEAKVFAILLSSKPGQFRLAEAERLKNDIKKKDKKAFIVIMDEITNEKMLGIAADCFINTACPRIVEDKFSKTIINIDEFVAM
ncbi:MAG: diphthamide biosynthesis enzyme Dph2 [Candidatus Aenigmarchaeota archaeon]|nr:diphthamide biosynthesis enzyme Dph2 [Candidatus Aenigmarchaeota archaeon]